MRGINALLNHDFISHRNHHTEGVSACTSPAFPREKHLGHRLHADGRIISSGITHHLHPIFHLHHSSHQSTTTATHFHVPLPPFPSAPDSASNPQPCRHSLQGLPSETPSRVLQTNSRPPCMAPLAPHLGGPLCSFSLARSHSKLFQRTPRWPIAIRRSCRL